MTRKKRNAYRKNKRNNLYKEAIGLMNMKSVSLGWSMKILKGKAYLNDPWEDSDSPTGWTQNCEWSGTCQHPCNGDC